MTDKKSSENRRKLLKSIAAGSGAIVAGKSLPESWSRPVVDSVMLPAHAQTSGFAGNYHYQNIRQASLNTENGSMFASIIESTIPAANAQAAPPFIDDYCVVVDSDGSWRAAIRVTQNGDLVAIWWTLVDGVVGGPAMPMTETLCGITHPPVTFQVTSGNTSQVSVVIMEGSIQNPLTTILAGTCPFTNPSGETCPPAASDIRLKTNIEALSISRAGYNLYKFQYIDEQNENTYVGVMAQDIISRNPEAIVQNESGFYMVRYGQLGLKMVTLEQWESEGPDSVELIH